MMERLRFAIIGCGLIGRKRLDGMPPGSLVAACDLARERALRLAEEAGPQCIATSTLEEAIAAAPDAVIVATRNADLARIGEVCLKAGKHVLIEKPVATSLSELSALEALAAANGGLVRAGYNHRYHPAFRKAREIFEAGELGQLMFIRGRYGHGGRVGYDREWRADPKQSGGGELLDQGVHLIDLAGWFLGSWRFVEGHVATYFWDMPVEDNAFISLRNAAGNTAWLQASCTEWKNQFSFEIYGRNGKLHIEGLGGSYGVERLSWHRMLPEMGPPETTIFEFPRGDRSWALETAQFMDDIRLHREPIPGLAEARAVLQAVETIYARDKEGRLCRVVNR